MKKLISLLCVMVVAVSAMAYDFTGKTFRGVETIGGHKMTITLKFKSNHSMTGTYSYAGKSETDNGMSWEVAGDYINFYDSSGDYNFLMIEEENGSPVLIMFDSSQQPRMTLREVSAPAKKPNRTGKKKSRR